MNRAKKHKIKREMPETSTSLSREAQEHDLAYYIHDRVELMHQVFSILKPKDLKAMAPECVRGISTDNLQELCTEQLLGISSKRLCAILDGAEPPSDTESSSRSASRSPAPMETISLDSISSDDEILSQSSKKKKHKHRRRDSKSKPKKKKSKDSPDEDTEKSKASRAGLTVLELLELQARARAIRAQLQQEQANKKTSETAAVESSHQSSDGEVEIKEEPTDVVEISSDEEKPRVDDLMKANPPSTSKEPEKNDKTASPAKAADKNKETKKSKDKKKKKAKDKGKDKNKNKDEDRRRIESTTSNDTESKKKGAREIDDNNKGAGKEIDFNKETDVNKKDTENKLESPAASQTVTKRINDLIITVPQQSSRKIKLNRNNKVTVSVPNVNTVSNAETANRVVSVTNSPENTLKSTVSVRKSPEKIVKSIVTNVAAQNKDKLTKTKDKPKKKLKKKEIRKSIDKEGSDHDEITLQLSDSEKMDLLENFDRKNYDNVSSSSPDSESSSESESDSSKDSSKKTEKSQEVSGHSEHDRIQKTDENTKNDETIEGHDKTDQESEKVTDEQTNSSNKESTEKPIEEINEEKDKTTPKSNDEESSSEESESDHSETTVKSVQDVNTTESTQNPKEIEGYISTDHQISVENDIVVSNINDIPLQEDTVTESPVRSHDLNKISEENTTETVNVPVETIPESKDDEENTVCSVSVEKVSESIDLVERSTEDVQTIESEENVVEKASKNSDLGVKSVENEAVIKSSTEQSETKSNKELSEGELSDHESSEVEALALKPEVVCISDEEEKKKKKKKDKKSKKEKKSKKSKSDFREGADQNFYRDSQSVAIEIIDNTDKENPDNKKSIITLDEDDDDVYEILELTDDSSCYEVEGTVLSKEPTAEEIEALSAKIDEIEREEVVTEEQIREHEKRQAEGQTTNEIKENVEEHEKNIENISWKDRYLGSKKVKRVLTTSNILNALRKKNKELKKKLEESKKKEAEVEVEKEVEKEIIEPVENNDLEEGSIEHYNTLQGSTKYVDPVAGPKEKTEQSAETEASEEYITEIQITTETTTKNPTELCVKSIDIQVTGEMKKDAKQLLKMYKKLLKYNDMTKPKDPNKKKKKSKKKKEKDGASSV